METHKVGDTLFIEPVASKHVATCVRSPVIPRSTNVYVIVVGREWFTIPEDHKATLGSGRLGDGPTVELLAGDRVRLLEANACPGCAITVIQRKA